MIIQNFTHEEGFGSKHDDHQNFADNCLAAHNAEREALGCLPLKWSSDLGEKAQNWAEHCAQLGHLMYSEKTGVGETVTVFPRSVSGGEVVSFWLSERSHYDFKQPHWQAKTSQFVQVVWRNTTEVGIGRAFMRDQQMIVVAFYRPPGNGNRPGEFERNVPGAENTQAA